GPRARANPVTEPPEPWASEPSRAVSTRSSASSASRRTIDGIGSSTRMDTRCRRPRSRALDRSTGRRWTGSAARRSRCPAVRTMAATPRSTRVGSRVAAPDDASNGLEARVRGATVRRHRAAGRISHVRQDKAVVFGKALEAGHSTVQPRGREATALGAIAMGVLLGLVSLAFCSTAAAQIVGSVSLNVERAGHSATRLGDGRILIAGGENAGGALSAAELYDPVIQRFALTGSLVVPRAEHTATLLTDGRVLIAGGRQGLAPPPFANHTATTPLASTEVFDPPKGSFSAAPPLTSAPPGPTGA